MRAQAGATECARLGMYSGASDGANGAYSEEDPRNSNTGVMLTDQLQIGVHDYAATTEKPVGDVLGYLAEKLGESVEIIGHGLRGYTEGYRVGAVEVYHHPDRPEMKTHILVHGSASDEIGTKQVLEIHRDLDPKVSRIDVFVDHCPFEPEEIKEYWEAGMVRTSVTTWSKAREDRKHIRNSQWHQGLKGDTFEMGSRTSERFARCYNSRGYTRFELEMKGKRSMVAANELAEALLSWGLDGFANLVLGMIRDFVDFVDITVDKNISRCPLWYFWDTFIGAFARVKLAIPQITKRSLAEAFEYVKDNYAPLLYALSQGMGWLAFRQMVQGGKVRQKPKHRQMVRDHLRLAMV